MLKKFKKSIAVMLTLAFVFTAIPNVGFAATFGGVTLEDTALSLTESFDSWTPIDDAYNGKCGNFTHRYSSKNTTTRRQPAINELATATAEMAPYKAAGDTYLDFRMMGGSQYTNKYGTDPTDKSNLVSTPRIYVQNSVSLGGIVDEKLHVSFEIKNDDLLKDKKVKYCEKWNDGDTKANWLLRMYTTGNMEIGLGQRSVSMPYKVGRWYKFDYVYDFGNDIFTAYVDGNKVYESGDKGFKNIFLINYTFFFQFIIEGAAKDIPEGQSSGMGIDNLSISLHKATDEITITKKAGLPAYELGTASIPQYDFGTEGRYTASIPCTLFDLGQSAQIVVASYNSDGSLDNVVVGTNVASDTLAKGKVLSATADIASTANKIKVFLLEDMGSIVPIIPETEITKVN